MFQFNLQKLCSILLMMLALQVHGKKLKLIIDENGLSDNNSHMVPWQGDKSNMIDRYLLSGARYCLILFVIINW